MSADTFLLIMVCIAAVPANLFPILFALGRWWTSLEGVTLMILAVGLGLMVDSSLLRRTLGEHYWGRDVLFGAVLFFVIGGMYAMTGALVRTRWREWRGSRAGR